MGDVSCAHAATASMSNVARVPSSTKNDRHLLARLAYRIRGGLEVCDFLVSCSSLLRSH